MCFLFVISGSKERTGVFQPGHAGYGRRRRTGGGTLVPSGDPNQRGFQGCSVQPGITAGRRSQAPSGSPVPQPAGQVPSGPCQGSDITGRHLHQQHQRSRRS